MSTKYKFSNNWFQTSAQPIWEELLPQLKPLKILEIGSFEGASACHLIRTNNWTDKLEIICIDTWEGGIEHKQRNIDMEAVESRFDLNINVAKKHSSRDSKITKLKGLSGTIGAKLVSEQMKFDFIYIDGSHQAPDVLIDAVNSFQLVRIGGVIGFDDYTWQENLSYGTDPLRTPKLAIDSFTNVFARKLRFINTANHQVYIQKISD